MVQAQKYLQAKHLWTLQFVSISLPFLSSFSLHHVPSLFHSGFPCSLIAPAVQHCPHSSAYPWDWKHSTQSLFLSRLPPKFLLPESFSEFPPVSCHGWGHSSDHFFFLNPMGKWLPIIHAFIQCAFYLTSYMCHAVWLEVDNAVLEYFKI